MYSFINHSLIIRRAPIICYYMLGPILLAKTSRPQLYINTYMYTHTQEKRLKRKTSKVNTSKTETPILIMWGQCTECNRLSG